MSRFKKEPIIWNSIVERIADLKAKFEKETGQSPIPTNEDMELIGNKEIKPPCGYCGKWSCYGNCA